jgi:N-glycosylase/DNA lyase
MKTLIKKIQQAHSSSIKKQIDSRLKSFEKVGKSKNKIFSELCFCILTANFQAEKSWSIQKDIEDLFHVGDEPTLRLELKKRGHRFWPQRAERIIKAREKRAELCILIKEKDEFVLREWLVENIKGIGMKESSHFLRNIGYKNIAIIDFHIVDLMVEEGLIKRPKTITKKKYLEIEMLLGELAREVNMSLAELDLYLWWMETGRVLK